jgi:hypothetical protein
MASQITGFWRSVKTGWNNLTAPDGWVNNHRAGVIAFVVANAISIGIANYLRRDERSGSVADIIITGASITEYVVLAIAGVAYYRKMKREAEEEVAMMDVINHPQAPQAIPANHLPPLIVAVAPPQPAVPAPYLLVVIPPPRSLGG